MCIRSITGPMIEELGFLSGHDTEFYPENTATIGEICTACPEQVPVYAKFVTMLTRGAYGDVNSLTTVADLIKIGRHFMEDLCGFTQGSGIASSAQDPFAA